MNVNALKGYIVSKGFNTTSFLKELNERGIKIGRNTFYRNLNGEQEFTRKEIRVIADILEMPDSDIIDIFFTEKVA